MSTIKKYKKFWIPVAIVLFLLAFAAANYLLITRLTSQNPLKVPTFTNFAAEQPVNHAEYYVSPTGTPSGDGSITKPWDLQTALNQPAAVKPGDTIWLRGGTYKGRYSSKLAGAAGKPITVRNYNGERATLDLNVDNSRDNDFIINGGYTNYWGIEVMSSHKVRTTQETGSHPTSVSRSGTAITVYGSNLKFINMSVHDLGNGFGFWEQSKNSELYGTLIYNNGWWAPDRGHGHGIYTQNVVGSKKRIIDVISTNNFATGMKAYGDQGHSIGYTFDGVITYNNGHAEGDPNFREYNLLVGSIRNPSDDITISNTYLYQPPLAKVTNLRLGYTNLNSVKATIKDNVVIGGSTAFGITHWKQLIVTGNTFLQGLRPEDSNTMLTSVHKLATVKASDYSWNNNAYYDGGRLSSDKKHRSFSFEGVPNQYGGGQITFDEWKAGTGFDANSTYVVGKSTQTKIMVRPNQYEKGRGNIAIYNPTHAATLPIDISRLGLSPRQKFEIRNAQDFYGAPVVSGEYLGETVTIPMTGLTVAPYIGNSPLHLPSNGPEFAAFVVVPLTASLTPTPTPTLHPTVTPTPATPSPTVPVTPPGCPNKSNGDANCDTRVDLADFEIWRNEFLNTSAAKTADFNLDGQVTIADFEVWRLRFTQQ